VWNGHDPGAAASLRRWLAEMLTSSRLGAIDPGKLAQHQLESMIEACMTMPPRANAGRTGRWGCAGLWQAWQGPQTVPPITGIGTEQRCAPRCRRSSPCSRWRAAGRRHRHRGIVAPRLRLPIGRCVSA
jgi:hypothetical protein